MRIAFLGTPDFAVPTLAALLAHGHEVCCVYSQPARPRGRGLSEELSAVARFASDRGIALKTPSALKGADRAREFSGLHLDAAVVVAYGLLLPRAILEAPRLGCFNLHASLLPRWRGAAPIQRAIMAGDEETGVVVMQMEKGLDTGPVLAEERVRIAQKTFGQLHDELAEIGAGLMVRTLAALERATATPHRQPGTGITYASKITREETRIDWRQSANELARLVRGLSPRPGAWCVIGGKRVKVLMADAVAGEGEAGTVLDLRPAIACGSGALRLDVLQREGRSPMNAADFLRGHPMQVGSILG